MKPRALLRRPFGAFRGENKDPGGCSDRHGISGCGLAPNGAAREIVFQEPLTGHEAIINRIADTATAPGLTVHSELDTDIYPPGVKVSDREVAEPRTTRRIPAGTELPHRLFRYEPQGRL